MGLINSLGDALVGGRKPLPKYDTGTLNNIVNSAKDEQTRMVDDTMPKLGAVTDKFKTNVDSAVDSAQKSRQDTNNAFLNSIREKRNALTNDQFNSGRTKILQSVQPAQDALRETLAGSGVGLQGGAAINALSKPVLQAASDTNDLAHSLEQGAQEADINAMGDVNKQDNSFILQKLGIDQDTYNTIMNSDRQDLKDQLNELLGISSQATADRLGIDQNAFSSEMAGTAAENQSRDALLSALLSGAGTATGAYLGTKRR